MPERSFSLQVLGEIPLTALRDSPFSFRSWLLKPYKEGTRVPQRRYFYMRLCAARVVSEHAFGMLKGRCRMLYKKNECVLDNIQLTIIACIVLHNICIHRNDPCRLRWKLEVNELSLIRGTGQGRDAGTTREAIANWLWQIREERAAIH